MMLMAERHRLFADNARPGHVVGAHELGPRPAQARRKEDAAENRHPRDGVEAAVEDLCHGLHLGVRKLSPEGPANPMPRSGRGGRPTRPASWAADCAPVMPTSLQR